MLSCRVQLPGINRDTDNPSVESYNQLVADTTRDEDIGSTWRNLGKDYVGTYQDPVGGQAASSGQDIAATTGVPHTTVGERVGPVCGCHMGDCTAQHQGLYAIDHA